MPATRSSPRCPRRTVAQAPRRTEAPAGLPPYLASLYDEAPLLSREQEAHLFRKMNYLKYRASRLRDRIDPARARTADLDEIERLLAEALAIRNQIVRANLRLVVSIARRQLGPRDDLFERVSDGNFVLIRAVERFDYSRGNKFSTYATWAIRNQFARAFRGKDRRQPQFLLGHDEASRPPSTPAPTNSSGRTSRSGGRRRVARLLARLGDRERRILVGRFGIGGGPRADAEADRQGAGDHEGTRPPDRGAGPGQAPRARPDGMIMYSMTLTLSGLYKDYFSLGQGLLKMVGDIHKVKVTPEDIEAIRQAMLTMPAHPDVEEGLKKLKDAGFRMVTLTNSPFNPNGQDPAGECRPGRVLRAAVQHRDGPVLQARRRSSTTWWPRSWTCRRRTAAWSPATSGTRSAPRAPASPPA